MKSQMTSCSVTQLSFSLLFKHGLKFTDPARSKQIMILQNEMEDVERRGQYLIYDAMKYWTNLHENHLLKTRCLGAQNDIGAYLTRRNYNHSTETFCLRYGLRCSFKTTFYSDVGSLPTSLVMKFYQFSPNTQHS